MNRERAHAAAYDLAREQYAAWAIGARSLAKALMVALLEPRRALVAFEEAGNSTARRG